MWEVFTYLTFLDGNNVRLTCRAYLEDVKKTTIHDNALVHDVEKWRVCFPLAKHLVQRMPTVPCMGNLPNLETLFVDGHTHGVSVSNVISLLQRPNMLRSVEVRNIQGVVDDDVMAQLSGIPRISLHRLNLVVTGFRCLEGVQVLELHMTGNSFHHMQALAELTSLRKLTIYFSNWMTDEIFSILKNLRLQELCVGGSWNMFHPLSDQAFMDMVGIEKVTLNCENNFLKHVTPNGFRALGGHQEVRILLPRFNYGLQFTRNPGVDNSNETWNKVQRMPPLISI